MQFGGTHSAGGPTEVYVMLVDVACYYCGSSNRAYYANENGYNLVKCRGCGLLYVTPRPSDDDLAAAHECGVHAGDHQLCTTWSFEKDVVAGYFDVLMDVYGKNPDFNGKQWLDIGCGHGEFMLALQSFSKGNLLVKGLEPNAIKRASAASHGLDVSFFDIRIHQNRYDFISLLNVFSHLPCPPSFLVSCASLLVPGGELLLQTGDASDLPVEKQHKPFHLPDHLSFASEHIVCSILKQCGFELLSLYKYPTFPFRCGMLRWAKELVKFILPGKRSVLKELIRRHHLSRSPLKSMYIRARRVC